MNGVGTLIGDSNGIFRTDENGEIRIPGLKPGKSVVVTEVRAPAGFILDTQSQTIQIQAGRTVSLTFKNQPKGSLIIQKRDSQTNEVLPGAEFRITTAAGCEVGLDACHSKERQCERGHDAHGEIHISGVTGTIVVKETRTIDGYTIDPATQTQTVKVNPQDTHPDRVEEHPHHRSDPDHEKVR